MTKKFYLLVALVLSAGPAWGQCQKIRVALPPALRDSTNPARFYQRDVARYFVESFSLNPNPIAATNDESTHIELGCLELIRPSLQNAFLNSGQNLSEMSIWSLRNDLSLDYLESRFLRNKSYVLPDALEKFSEETNFKSWPSELIENSRPKALSRRIYTSPGSFRSRLRVAETLLPLVDSVASSIRETEVIIEREKYSNQWDYFSYSNETGKLELTSQFGKNGQHFSSPAVCLACHYDMNERNFVPIGPESN